MSIPAQGSGESTHTSDLDNVSPRDVAESPEGVADDGTVKRGTVGDALFSAILVVVAVLATAEVRNFPDAGQIVPRIILYPLVVLSLANLLFTLYRWRQSLRTEASEQPTSGLSKELQAILWVVGYTIIVMGIGLTLASITVLPIFLRIYGESWRSSIVTTVVTVGVIYGIFHKLAGFDLYQGMLGLV